MRIYYLWKDKRSTPEKVIAYITDYKIIKNGKVWAHRHGWVEADLITSSTRKQDCVEAAQKLVE